MGEVRLWVGAGVGRLLGPVAVHVDGVLHGDLTQQVVDALELEGRLLVVGAVAHGNDGDRGRLDLVLRGGVDDLETLGALLGLVTVVVDRVLVIADHEVVELVVLVVVRGARVAPLGSVVGGALLGALGLGVVVERVDLRVRGGGEERQLDALGGIGDRGVHRLHVHLVLLGAVNLVPGDAEAAVVLDRELQVLRGGELVLGRVHVVLDGEVGDLGLLELLAVRADVAHQVIAPEAVPAAPGTLEGVLVEDVVAVHVVVALGLVAARDERRLHLELVLTVVVHLRDLDGDLLGEGAIGEDARGAGGVRDLVVAGGLVADVLEAQVHAVVQIKVELVVGLEIALRRLQVVLVGAQVVGVRVAHGELRRLLAEGSELDEEAHAREREPDDEDDRGHLEHTVALLGLAAVVVEVGSRLPERAASGGTVRGDGPLLLNRLLFVGRRRCRGARRRDGRPRSNRFAPLARFLAHAFSLFPDAERWLHEARGNRSAVRRFAQLDHGSRCERSQYDSDKYRAGDTTSSLPPVTDYLFLTVDASRPRAMRGE